MVDTIAKKIDELAIKSVRNEVRVEMNPPELGSVIVNIRKDMAGVTATLNASNEPLRQALHESRNDLAGALADRNIGQVRIEVRAASADSMSMGQQFNQAQSQNQSQNHHPRHTAPSVEKRALESNDQVDQPRARRAVTTLLDMEI
jgi:flagellar hook-length control protein FliK